MSATRHLAEVDPDLGGWIKKIGPIKLPKPEHPEPYAALVSAVAHQQLHAKAAETILGRMKTHCGETMPDPATLLALPDEVLRSCGFSRTKAAALRDIAAKAAEGVIPTAAKARRLSDTELIEQLTTIRGVGRWTVEMLLIFTLKRPDVFPVDDFGVREGYRLMHRLDAQPKPRAFGVIGQAYAPYRSTAALYLWRVADLAKIKTKKG